jgi:hypothetical protein
MVTGGTVSSIERGFTCAIDARVIDALRRRLPRILPRIDATRGNTSEHQADTAPPVSRHNVTSQPDPTPRETDS